MTMAFDLKDNVDVVQSIAPALIKIATNGGTVDLQGYHAAVVVFSVGLISDGAHTPKVQEAPDDGTGNPGAWTDVAAADLQGTLGAFAASTVQRVGYIGTKRFVRAVVTSSGATGAMYEAAVVRGRPSSAPLT